MFGLKPDDPTYTRQEAEEAWRNYGGIVAYERQQLEADLANERKRLSGQTADDGTPLYSRYETIRTKQYQDAVGRMAGTYEEDYLRRFMVTSESAKQRKWDENVRQAVADAGFKNMFGEGPFSIGPKDALGFLTENRGGAAKNVVQQGIRGGRLQSQYDKAIADIEALGERPEYRGLDMMDYFTQEFGEAEPLNPSAGVQSGGSQDPRAAAATRRAKWGASGRASSGASPWW